MGLRAEGPRETGSSLLSRFSLSKRKRSVCFNGQTGQPVTGSTNVKEVMKYGANKVHRRRSVRVGNHRR